MKSITLDTGIPASAGISTSLHLLVGIRQLQAKSVAQPFFGASEVVFKDL